MEVSFSLMGRLCSWRSRNNYALEASLFFCIVNRQVFVMLWEARLFLPFRCVWRRRISFSYACSPPFPSFSLSIFWLLSMNFHPFVMLLFDAVQLNWLWIESSLVVFGLEAQSLRVLGISSRCISWLISFSFQIMSYYSLFPVVIMFKLWIVIIIIFRL